MDLLESEHGATSIAAELLSTRKALAKLDVRGLGTRQLREGFIQAAEAELADLDTAVKHFLAPALLPGGPIAKLVTVNLDAPNKPNQLRAGDAAAALARLGEYLLQHPNQKRRLDVDALFLETVASGLRTKSSLVLISHLVHAVPHASIPGTLLQETLDELASADFGHLRAEIIVALMTKSREEHLADSAEMIIQSLLPTLQASLSSTDLQHNLNRYLFPQLFQQDASIISPLLLRLEETSHQSGLDMLPCWISVAATGVSCGLLTIGDLPRETLEDALVSEDADVRGRAYELVSGSKDPLQLFDPHVATYIKLAFKYNAVLPDAGARSEFLSSTHSFFTRLKVANVAETRANRKAAKAGGDSVPVETTSGLQRWAQWLLDEMIDPALRSARRAPVSRALLALGVLELYLSIFVGDNKSLCAELFTETRVSMLIGCQASEYTEVRSRSLSILRYAPIPLQGYTSLSDPDVRLLLQSANRSFANPRKTQNEAAVAALTIVFDGIICREAHTQPQGTAFVLDLVDRTEAELIRAEARVKIGMDDLALHGLLAALKSLIGTISFREQDSQRIWAPVLQRITRLTDRVWRLTRTVMSLSSNPIVGENSDRPAHEIAKAYMVLEAGQRDEDGGDSGTDPRKIISACWRATKEAAELLSAVTAQPLQQGGRGQKCWTHSEIDQAGRTLLTWLHEIRHRGTFSKVSDAFARLVEAAKAVALREVVEGWLQLELVEIATEAVSTTRRSAALPYIILALVSGDEALLDIAVDRLVSLANASDGDVKESTRIHCFNILKIILLDAKQSKFFGRYFERTVMTVIEAFASPNWNVRNVGLILFSTLVHRSLITSSTAGQNFYRSRTTLATRQTFSAWHRRYPGILPSVIRYLSEFESTGKVARGQHTPLFPMLIIIRSLRWSEKDSEIQGGLKRAVRPFLGHREWQIRTAASQALSSLLSPTEALREASLIDLEQKDLNSVHGRLLYLNNLISQTIDWETVDQEAARNLEAFLMKTITRLRSLQCPPVRGAALFCASSLLDYLPSCSDEFRSQVAASAESLIRTGRPLLPGDDNLYWGASEIVFRSGPSVDILLEMLDMRAEQDRLATLWRLADLPASLVGGVFGKVLSMAMDRRQGDAVQIVALNAVAGTWSPVSWPSDVLAQIDEEKWTQVLQSFELLLREKSVPLREAAAPALAWALRLAMQASTRSAGRTTMDVVDVLARHLLVTSHEDQPSRRSAIQALKHLPLHLGPVESPAIVPLADARCSLLGLHQVLLRLLQDDDDDIRSQACEIVGAGEASRRTCQIRAYESWWDWISGFLRTASEADSAPWITWLCQLAVDEAGFDEDAGVLSSRDGGAAYDASYLFAVEKQNLFRDPLEDAANAAHVLSLLPDMPHAGLYPANLTYLDHAAAKIQEMEDVVRSLGISPIDDAYQVMLVLPRRKSLIDIAAGKRGLA